MVGEQITQKGIGNGISLIIFAGIVSGIPTAIDNTIKSVNSGTMNFLVVLAILAIMIITILSIIYVEAGREKGSYQLLQKNDYAESAQESDELYSCQDKSPPV